MQGRGKRRGEREEEEGRETARDRDERYRDIERMEEGELDCKCFLD